MEERMCLLREFPDSVYGWEISNRSLEELEAKFEIHVPFVDGDFLQHGRGERVLTASGNRRLRDCVRAKLNGSGGISRDMAKWIVSGWGGIHSRRRVDPSGNTSLDVFAAAIGSTRQSAEEFSRRQGMGGVASWSKLLAFAYPEFAVFDARTAMAANYDRLVYDGATTFFHMPPPRKKDIIAVRKQFRTRAGDQASFKLGYPDYLKYLGDRLESWKACGALAPEADIFDVEMRLFMIGPQAARKLLEKTASS